MIKNCMKQIITITLLFIIGTSCSKKESNTYNIFFEIEGYADSTKFKLLDLDRGLVIDSQYVFQNRLEFSGVVDEPFIARIHTIDNEWLVLYIEKGITNITGKKGSFRFSHFDGSELNNVMVKYRDMQKDFELRRDSLADEVSSKYYSDAKGNELEIKELQSLVSEIDKEIFEIRKSSIETESPSFYTLQELYFLRNQLTKDELTKLLQRFPSNLKNTKMGEVINSFIENKRLEIGDKFVDIKGLNVEGSEISLSVFEGKLILLEFWASWCGPCRQENPKLVKLYEKYKDNGFEIYGFSVDDNISSWKKAIEKDKLTWTNVMDYEKGSYSKMSALYNVQAIPSSYLINSNGIIVAKDLRGEQLENKIKEELNNHGL